MLVVRFAAPIPARADETGTARAGIVIDFGNGTVQTQCIDLGADGQATGEELLVASGFDVLMEYSALGGAVCKIGGQGCNYPEQACMCQCMSSPCVYWSYNHLQNGQWVYSSLGASNYTVHAGEVDGWAWGAGSLVQGAAPPVRTFNEICALPTATATPTWTPEPTATARPTDTPRVTDTPWPTATWTPVPTIAVVAGTATATTTPSPTATPTVTASPTATAGVTATASPVQTATQPAVAMNLSATPTASMTATTAPAALQEPTVAVAVVATSTPTTSPLPRPAVAAMPRAPVVRDGEPVPRLNPAAANAPPQWTTAQDMTTVQPDWLGVFGLTVALSGLLAAVRRVRARGRVRARPAALARPSLADRLRSLPWLAAAIYGLTAGIGLLALLYPFLAAAVRPAVAATPLNTPLLMTALAALCFVALLFEVQGQTVSAKLAALLGVLVAINSLLRFLEVSIPGPGGFTPIFFLIILTGYVYGGRFGFLMGALTLLVSALITGGIGPWLPGQMFTAGWLGLLAPLARPLMRLTGAPAGSRREVVMLAVLAGTGGVFYGVAINLWFWPYMTGPAEQYWQAGVSLGAAVQRYVAYYVATSLVWDVFAVAGNVLMMALFGAATLRALRRFRQRFDFAYQPVTARWALATQSRGEGL